MSTAPGVSSILSPAEPREVAATAKTAPRHRYGWVGMWPWVAVHVAVFGAIWSGVTWEAVVVCAALFAFRTWAVTGVYHRYFAHRTYQTSRWFQLVLAWCATMTSQKGVLWWAAHHRGHHLYSDTERDLHSPKQDGFWHSHAGWIFAGTGDTQWKRIEDFAQYPELVWLNKHWYLPPTMLGVAVFLLFGWPGLFIGFFLSQVLSWHSTYVINSLCHVWGGRRFETKDTSRNNLFLALLTFGEGWHNNHHHYMNSARQGFYWWEIDITYYVLRALQAVRLIWDIKEPPQRVLDEGRRLDAARSG